MSKKGKIFTYIFLSISSILSIFPFIWMMIGATNLSKDVIKGKLTFGGQLINNIKELFNTTNVFAGIGMSLTVAIIGTIITLLLCSLAGYGFEIFKSKTSDRIMGVIMLSLMMPFAAIMIPLFRLFSKIGLLDTIPALILPTMATAFLIYFFRQNTKSFEKEMLEAARIDGLTEFGAFLKIYVPSMKSTYAAAAIITFMSYWNSYLWPLIAIKTPEKRTLPLLISSLSSAYTPDYGVIMVAIIITTIPSAILFFLMQKNFVEGMVGSIK
ncbi:carbohydrate ABC transporter permease [Clostridium carnis]